MERYFNNKSDVLDVGYLILLESNYNGTDYLVVHDPYFDTLGVYHKYPKVWELEKIYPGIEPINEQLAQETLIKYLKYLKVL